MGGEEAGFKESGYLAPMAENEEEVLGDKVRDLVKPESERFSKMLGEQLGIRNGKDS